MVRCCCCCCWLLEFALRWGEEADEGRKETAPRPLCDVWVCLVVPVGIELMMVMIIRDDGDGHDVGRLRRGCLCVCAVDEMSTRLLLLHCTVLHCNNLQLPRRRHRLPLFILARTYWISFFFFFFSVQAASIICPPALQPFLFFFTQNKIQINRFRRLWSGYTIYYIFTFLVNIVLQHNHVANPFHTEGSWSGGCARMHTSSKLVAYLFLERKKKTKSLVVPTATST